MSKTVTQDSIEHAYPVHQSHGQ